MDEEDNHDYSYIISLFPKDKYSNLVFFPPNYPEKPSEIQIFYKYFYILLKILNKIKDLPRYGFNRLLTELRRPFRYLSTQTIALAFNLIKPYTKNEYFVAEYFDGYVINIESQGYDFLNELTNSIEEFLKQKSKSLTNDDNDHLKIPLKIPLKEIITTLSSLPKINQSDIEMILKLISYIVLEIKFSEKMTLGVIRKLLKYNVFTEEVLSQLYDSKKVKNIDKLMEEFPALKNKFLNKNIECGFIENLDENIINNFILNKIEKMEILDLLNKPPSDDENKSDLYVSINSILKNKDLQSYIKEYVLAIHDTV